MRLISAVSLLVILFVAAPAHAADGNDERGWSFSGSFYGSANSEGVVTRAEPAVGYRFNRHVSMYAGLPYYFVNLSSSAATSSGTTSNADFMSGIGNAFLGFRAGVQSEILNYSSTLEFTAPTGDRSRGFSTGRVTADWTNRFSRTFSSVTPFGNIGIANTVSDTTFFVRPFTSLGIVGHFEGGATYDVVRAVQFGVSAYAVQGSGDQRIVSKLIERGGGSATLAAAPVTSTDVASTGVASTDVASAQASRGFGSGAANRVFETQQETVLQAESINDHGYSAWFTVSPKPEVDFHVGYSRSVNYDFNSVFFGVGFHVGQ